MIITTYKCDRCGHEQPTDEQMWGVGIVCGVGLYNNTQVVNVQHKALWCRKCAVEFNLLPAPTKYDAPPQPPPSFEDIIREIAREEAIAVVVQQASS